MSVLMTKDKKELIVTCKCHCEQGFHICIDNEDDELYGFLCFMKGNFETESNLHFWRAYCIKMKKIWSKTRWDVVRENDLGHRAFVAKVNHKAFLEDTTAYDMNNQPLDYE